ncbi:hypothetical protein F4604DRAFT_1684046 [Suillus subluteus]|nr:hypothetical protein F4604DRAFT_1684046 [Suillus subluteus]
MGWPAAVLLVSATGVGRPREQLLLTGPAHSSSLWEGTGRLASHIWLSRPVPPYSLQEGAGRRNVSIWPSRPVHFCMPPYSLREGAGRYHVGIWPSRPVHFCSPGLADMLWASHPVACPPQQYAGRWPAGLGMNSYFLLWSAWRDILLAYICHFEANLSTFEEIFIGVELYVVI